VGTNVMSGKGADSALMAATPPEVSAGKNFTASRPSSMAARISVAVTVPGSTGTPRSWARRTTAALRPGHDVGGARVDGLVDLLGGADGAGAPRRMSELADMRAIASAAAGVRKVTSATGRPPATSASARPGALSASSMTTTGMREWATMGDRRASITVLSRREALSKAHYQTPRASGVGRGEGACRQFIGP
jgi:hypothetical protein